MTTTLPALLPDAFPGFGEGAPLDLPPLDYRTARQVADLLTSREFDAWSEALARVGNCARPIRLYGGSQTVDPATGEILSTYSSSQEPLGVTHVRCGNRRASECPSCSRLYAGDMFQLIRAGVSGGKTVPATVSDNPLVFATVTAPSFGTVHGHRTDRRPCRPHGRGESIFAHGRPRTCHTRHREDDPALGQPLCPGCYDHASHLVWQWWAPDLWRRFTIALRRLVARTLCVPATRLSELATVQYAKVAEYQLRGVVHFHALIRLDGPKTTDGFAPAPAAVDAVLALVDAGNGEPDGTGPACSDDTGTIDNPHHQRLRATARRLAARAHDTEDGPYALLGKWVHMLGFRGHFASKSRRYSITLGALRRARRRAQALIAEARDTGRPLDLAALEADLLADDAQDTTLVIGHWSYAGIGWRTDAERVLANAAAARAREYDQWKAERRKEQTRSD